ncbi:5'-nucleotidase SurE-like [Zingiber officinale]|uniref:5'-nucleotidase SurE-like n=1 Tax=Zingiber officinale TaxID=94328 RepID=UPI001C4CCF0B|nr:5'-nucleotidase SurE-like [Zingiber officinale]
MTDPDSAKSNHLPPNLVANLQSVLIGRRAAGGGDADSKPAAEEDPQIASSADASQAEEAAVDDGLKKPIVLVTNADGIGSPGITFLVEALVSEGQCAVHVCAPDSDKSLSGHAITLYQTVAAASAEIKGASAFEITGTPADCVSLALSGALYSWSKPALVISGINKGSNCGYHCFYSGAVASAREALLSGVPSLVFSLNWKKDESKETDFKDAADACLPLINAALRDINKGIFPKSCLLNIEIPTSPSANKGFKLTRQSLWKYTPSWQGVSANRQPGQFMSMHQSLGIQLAQLGRDASAAGAARRIGTQRKLVEVESVATTGKTEQKEVVKKYFRLEFVDKEQEAKDEDYDFRALENGYIAVTPISLELQMESEIQASASNWLATALERGEEATEADA